MSGVREVVRLQDLQNYIFACFYRCVTWSLTLSEERRLRVFENRPKRDDVRGEWRKRHNKELNHLYVSPNTVRVIKWRKMRWAGNLVCMCARRVA